MLYDGSNALRVPQTRRVAVVVVGLGKSLTPRAGNVTALDSAQLQPSLHLRQRAMELRFSHRFNTNYVPSNEETDRMDLVSRTQELARIDELRSRTLRPTTPNPGLYPLAKALFLTEYSAFIFFSCKTGGHGSDPHLTEFLRLRTSGQNLEAVLFSVFRQLLIAYWSDLESAALDAFIQGKTRLAQGFFFFVIA
jgi:hypothetical protein